MRMHVLLVALFLFTASGCIATEAPLMGCLAYQFQEEEAEPGVSWAAIMIGVLVAVIMIIGLVYMGSQLMRRRDWEAWCRMELWQTLIAASMIFISFWFSAFSCTLAFHIAGDDPFMVADDYLSELIFGELIPSIGSLWEFSWQAQKKTAFLLGFSSCFTGFCFAPYAGYSMIAYNLDTFAGLLVPLSASLLFQRVALNIAQSVAYAYLLPMGFVLKVIPFTREAGATLIAFAIALYIVWPLTYVFNAVVMEEVRVDPAVANLCSSEGGSALDSALFASMGAGTGLCEALRNVGYVLPQAVFLPALNITITVAFGRALSKIFQTDYQMVGGVS